METKVLKKGDLLSHLLLAILEIETLMKLIVPKNPSTFQNCLDPCGFTNGCPPMAQTHGFPVTRNHRGQALRSGQ